MYVFKIIEIEQLIFSYLDYCVDFSTLKRMDKKYNITIGNHKIYKELYNFDKWKLNFLEDKFIEACKTNLFVAKYIFYRYKTIDIHVDNERFFQYCCADGYLDVAKWLWSLDGKIDLHANSERIFQYSCAGGNLDVVKWLWSLDGKIRYTYS